jgi:hypothetical protein
MPLSFTPLLRLKRCQACDQWHSSPVPTFLTSSHCELRANTEGEAADPRYKQAVTAAADGAKAAIDAERWLRHHHPPDISSANTDASSVDSRSSKGGNSEGSSSSTTNEKEGAGGGADLARRNSLQVPAKPPTVGPPPLPAHGHTISSSSEDAECTVR